MASGQIKKQDVRGKQFMWE